MASADERVEKLLTLLEAERAGVLVGRFLAGEAADQVERDLMERILDGERESCRVLGRLVLRFAGNTGGAVGDFHRKVEAIPDRGKRLDLLIRGQEWVVRKLDEAIGDWDDPGIRRDLQRVLDVHVENIAECKRFAAGEVS